MSEETTQTEDTSGDDLDLELSAEAAEEGERQQRERETVPVRTEPRRRVAAEKPEEDAEIDAEEPAKGKEKPKEEPPKRYKAKINGREQEIDAAPVDALATALGVSPEDLLRGPASMLKAGQERLRKAAEIERESKAVLERLKKDPRAALREVLGGDEAVAKLAVEVVQGLMDAERLTPEQRRIRELEAAEAERAAKAKEEAEKAAQTETEAEQARYAERLNGEIKGLLEKGRLPQDPYVVKRLASLMFDHLEAGGDAEGLAAEDFLPLLNDTLKKEHEAYLGKLTGEQIAELYPEMAAKVRKHFVAQAQKRRGQVPAQPERRERTNGVPQRKAGSVNDALRSFISGR